MIRVYTSGKHSDGINKNPLPSKDSTVSKDKLLCISSQSDTSIIQNWGYIKEGDEDYLYFGLDTRIGFTAPIPSCAGCMWERPKGFRLVLTQINEEEL